MSVRRHGHGRILSLARWGVVVPNDQKRFRRLNSGAYIYRHNLTSVYFPIYGTQDEAN